MSRVEVPHRLLHILADSQETKIGRESGILLHITSLPSSEGIGDLGEQAHQMVDTLVDMGQRWWQMLPVGPTGFRDSPYQSPSTFAGNPLLIDLRDLQKRGLVEDVEIDPLRNLPRNRVDFAGLIGRKTAVLATAADDFLRGGGDDAYQAFRKTPWLEDYSLYAALKEANGLRPWTDWDRDLALRDSSSLANAGQRLRTEIERQKVIQYFFHQQWEDLRHRVARQGVGLIGDLPIFVAHDSADVWANQHLFHLDEDGHPTVVAGVPPDYFSITGQRWGNPLYRWDIHRETGYQWWLDRLGAIFQRFDRVRIDHFRGFTAYWEISADEPTAVNGHWVEAPGHEFFTYVEGALGRLPIIAEDLGIITEKVTQLRRRFGFPGMRVAQFGYDQELDTAIHHPSHYSEDVVAYTGTHDNDTTNGWFWGNNRRHDRRRLTKHRKRLLQEVGTRGEEIHWDLIRLVWSSAAHLAVAPLQDLAGLGSEARMNSPGTELGNWVWRMEPGNINTQMVERIRSITADTGRT